MEKYNNNTKNTTTTITKANNNNNSNNKRYISPFRIRTGHIVAVRMRNQQQLLFGNNNINNNNSSNNNNNNWINVWTDPHPIRDTNYALIGKTIRCFIPNNNNTTSTTKSNNNNNDKSKTKTLLEGEIIRIIETTTQNNNNNNNNISNNIINVELLIDKNQILHFPFLSRINEGININNNKKFKKQYQYEQKIRGYNKCIVIISLQNHCTTTTIITNNNTNVNVVGYKWVIQKRIPAKLFATKIINNNDDKNSTSNNKNNSNKNGGTTTTAAKTTVKNNDNNNSNNNNIENNGGSTNSTTSAGKSKSNNINNTNNNNKASSYNKLLNINNDGCNDNSVTTTTTTTTTKKRKLIITKAIFPAKTTTNAKNDIDDHSNNNTNDSNNISNKRELSSNTILNKNVSSKTINTNNNDDDKKQGKKRRRRRIIITPSTVTTVPTISNRHVGDGNDSSEQQIHNFRWLSGKYYDILLMNMIMMIQQQQQENATTTDDKKEHESMMLLQEQLFISNMGLIGKVIQVDTTTTANNNNENNNSNTNNNTLAMVTIQRMFIPQYTLSGKTCINNKSDNNNNDNTNNNNIFYHDAQNLQFQIPIEHLIIIYAPSTKSKTTSNNGDNNELLYYNYSFPSDTFFMGSESVLFDDSITTSIRGTASSSDTMITSTKTMNGSNNNGKSYNGPAWNGFCHRCRRRARDHRINDRHDDDTVMRQCQNYNDYCLVKAFINNDDKSIWWCNSCMQQCHNNERNNDENNNQDDYLPCCVGTCDCRICTTFLNSSSMEYEFESEYMDNVEKLPLKNNSPDDDQEEDENNDNSNDGKKNMLQFAAVALRNMQDAATFALPPEDFFVFSNVQKLPPVPQVKPITRIKSRFTTSPSKKKLSGRRSTTPRQQQQQQWNSLLIKQSSSSGGKQRTKKEKRNGKREREKESSERGHLFDEDYSVFKPTCARSIAYCPSKRGKYNCMNSSFSSTQPNKLEIPRNLRDIQERTTRLITEQKNDSIKASSSSRAARANQRRLMKDVVSTLGSGTATNLGLIDALATREPQLRFDRSSIHAWGVFADEAIAAGEMIIEYRGELIGNAVAERREIEYEAAKIGSDYMFRIDTLNVCDATKQGNVARFINASCDPNCYTKIITLDGTKRIVIYAKKDIDVGDELCYDYKFPLEYDETKRIPCHCGARDCRGFMNWDKRYTTS